MEQKRYNEAFIELLDKLNNIMLKRGEPFRARAYQKAQESIMTYPDNIFSPNQLKELRSEYISTKSDLMFASKQSQVAKATEALGLKESIVPPFKIEVDSTILFKKNN